MYLEDTNSFVNLKDVITITIDKNNPKVIIFTYLNNCTVNVFNTDEETAKENLKLFSKKATAIQSNNLFTN